MLEDAGDDVGLSHLGDDANQCTATPALAEIDVKHTLEPAHPVRRCPELGVRGLGYRLVTLP